MIKRIKSFTYNNLHFVLIGTLGALLIGPTGLPMGWMLGSTLAVALLSLYSLKKGWNASSHLHPIWKSTAQMILAIQVGNHLDASLLSHMISGRVLFIFIVFIFLILICTSGVAYLFSKLTRTSMITAWLATCPGGVSAVPILAKDMKGDPFLVSTLHVLRVLLVACSIPPLTALVATDSLSLVTPSLFSRVEPLYENHVYECLEFFHNHPLLWTLSLFLGGLVGYALFRFFRFPSALLIGSIVGAGLLQYLASSYVGLQLTAWLPNWMNLLMQIFIGITIGLTLKPDLFSSLRRTLPVGLLIVSMIIVISLGFSWMAHLFLAIPTRTAILSLAPGGLAVMVATAISLHANATFVASVQTVRLLFILLSLFGITTWAKIKQRSSF